MPKYISSDNDPLYRFHQWQANLRILEVTEIKTIPYVPLSHPFVERLIGSFVMDNKRADHSLYIGSLPRRARRRQNFADAHVSHLFSEMIAKDGIAVPQQVLLVSLTGERAIYLALELDRSWTDDLG